MPDTMIRTGAPRRPSSAAAPGEAEVSRNLVGQRLGRKGAETRERAVTAMLRLLEDPQGPQVTLTGVAREARVGMTSLYLYFPDLGELLLAALRRVTEVAGPAFAGLMNERWPDAGLQARCLAFGEAHVAFWRRHARLLHMRNSFADAFDLRVLRYRQETAMPILDLLVRQMDGPPGPAPGPCLRTAVVLLTGMERVVTVVTNPHFMVTARDMGEPDAERYAQLLIEAQAELVALAIRDWRVRNRAAAGASMGAATSARDAGRE